MVVAEWGLHGVGVCGCRTCIPQQGLVVIQNPDLFDLSVGPLYLVPPSLALSPDMRYDVQEIFKMTPHQKQVMMFSATLSKEVRPVCKKFMHNVSARVWNSEVR